MKVWKFQGEDSQGYKSPTFRFFFVSEGGVFPLFCFSVANRDLKKRKPMQNFSFLNVRCLDDGRVAVCGMNCHDHLRDRPGARIVAMVGRSDGRMARSWLHDVVGEVDQELGEAAFRGSIVPQDRRKGGVAKRFGETLAKCLTGAGVVGESVTLATCQ